VQIQAVVAAVMVMLPAAVAAVVPEAFQPVEGGGLLPVEPL
jgi:hypothetical protein